MRVLSYFTGGGVSRKMFFLNFPKNRNTDYAIVDREAAPQPVSPAGEPLDPVPQPSSKHSWKLKGMVSGTYFPSPYFPFRVFME